MSTLHETLDRLASKIIHGQIEPVRPSQGADVVILEKAPVLPPGGFYPDPRFVVTPHVNALSWLFHALSRAFCRLDGYGYWKEELFGSLANAAERHQAAHPRCSAIELLLVVLERARALARQFEGAGTIPTLPVTMNNRILDDLRGNEP